MAYVRFRQELVGISEASAPFPVTAPLSPGIVVASVCIFSGFSLLHVRRGYPVIAGSTFMIYLVHVGVWDVLARVKRHIYVVCQDNRILIPLTVASVFLVSLTISYGIHGWECRNRDGAHPSNRSR